MKHHPNEDIIRTGIREIVEADGTELVDLEWKGRGPQQLLRILIHTHGGISLEDCRRISRQVEAFLDEKNLLEDDPYTLEVASPGLDRPLITGRDFERRIGETVRLHLKEVFEGRKRWKGTLEGVESDTLKLCPDKSEPISIPLDLVKKGKILI
ncbi:MAG: ribosome maturation factor RimP [Planctomycetota bacterium]|jgi:ribosome maturation factor RimP|nr:ribosome maturation factor RimP [Planctomycetota bacterium]